MFVFINIVGNLFFGLFGGVNVVNFVMDGLNGMNGLINFNEVN